MGCASKAAARGRPDRPDGRQEAPQWARQACTARQFLPYRGAG
jgi:hypothetical protein